MRSAEFASYLTFSRNVSGEVSEYYYLDRQANAHRSGRIPRLVASPKREFQNTMIPSDGQVAFVVAVLLQRADFTVSSHNSLACELTSTETLC